MSLQHRRDFLRFLGRIGAISGTAVFLSPITGCTPTPNVEGGLQLPFKPLNPTSKD